MSRNNGDGKNLLRNGILLDLNAKFAEVMEKQGEILGEIKALRTESERRADTIARLDSKFSAAFKKINERLDAHLTDHITNPNVMGAYPFLKKYTKKHWKIALLIFIAVQIATAALIAKYGVEKIIGLFN